LDGSQISAVVVVPSVGFDHDERNRVLFDEDALGLSALSARKFLEYFNTLLIFLLLFFLLFFFGLLLDALLSGCGIFLNESLCGEFLHHARNEGIIEAFSELFDADVQSFVDDLEVFS
jgi:hypothetical protein